MSSIRGGDILVAPSSWQWVNPNEYVHEKLSDGIHTLIIGCTSAWFQSRDDSDDEDDENDDDDNERDRRTNSVCTYVHEVYDKNRYSNTSLSMIDTKIVK